MKALWKGTVSFGLVTIPVKLFSATQARTPGFALVHKTCKTRLHYQRWCAECKHTVAWSDTIKGLKLDGGYALFTQADIHRLMPSSTNTIHIIKCVNGNVIPPIYFAHHFYLAADETTTAHAYTVLYNALHASKAIALGHGILRNREYLFAIQPYEGILLASSLHYAHELRPTQPLATQSHGTASAQEIVLAQRLVQHLSTSTFDITTCKDTFYKKLRAAIRSLQKGKVSKEEIAQITPSLQKVSSLVEQLEYSIKNIHHTTPSPQVHKPRRRQ